MRRRGARHDLRLARAAADRGAAAAVGWWPTATLLRELAIRGADVVAGRLDGPAAIRRLASDSAARPATATIAGFVAARGALGPPDAHAPHRASDLLAALRGERLP